MDLLFLCIPGESQTICFLRAVFIKLKPVSASVIRELSPLGSKTCILYGFVKMHREDFPTSSITSAIGKYY